MQAGRLFWRLEEHSVRNDGDLDVGGTGEEESLNERGKIT